jgi:hypothetical protein
VKMCGIFALTSKSTFLLVRIVQRDIFINVLTSSYKVPFILARSSWNLHFLHRFSKNILISNVMKVRFVEAELFHVDGRTEGWTDRQASRS